MKEIMFRVWDERNHVIFAADDVYRCLRFGNSIAPPNNDFTMAIEREEIIEAMIEGKGRLRLLQYTGLKDKDGVEIYEGDILNPCGAVVHWDARLAGWSLQWKGAALSVVSMDLMRVVGNIHENPELLDREGERRGKASIWG